MKLGLSYIKRGLVAFWALWSSLVFASNLTDGLRSLGLLPSSFPFASGNYLAIVDVTQIYGTAPMIAAALFLGVLGWDALNVFLFWRATSDGEGSRAGRFGKVDTAFAVGLTLWGALMLADELFLSYNVGPFEETHRSIFVAMLVSFLAVRLLPRE
jgi:hypothetical protein